MGKGALWATILEVARVGHNLVTKPPPPPKSENPRISVIVIYRGADHRTTKWNLHGALPGWCQHMLPHQMTHRVNFTNKGYFPIHLFAFIPSFPISLPLILFFAILFSLDPPIQFWKTVVKNGHLCLVLDIEKTVTPSQFKYNILARIFFFF